MGKNTLKNAGNILAQGLMAMGQGITGQPFLTSYQANQQKQKELEAENQYKQWAIQNEMAGRGFVSATPNITPEEMRAMPSDEFNALIPPQGFTGGQGLPIRPNVINVAGQTFAPNAALLSNLQSTKGSFITVTNPETGVKQVVPTKQAAFDRQTNIMDQNQWSKFISKNDPKLASSRSTLGVVTNANLRANRALEILDNPTITKQDLQAVVSDFSGIMQGGVPTDQIMKHSDYMTAYSHMKSIMQYLSGNPQEVLTPKIKEHIRRNLNALRAVDNQYLKDHLSSSSKTYKYLKDKFPDEWKGFEENVNNLINGYQTASGGEQTSGGYTEGQTATNPKTGQKITYKGGKWQ